MFKFVAVFGSLVLNTFTTVPSSSLAVARHVKFRGDRFVFLYLLLDLFAYFLLITRLERVYYSIP